DGACGGRGAAAPRWDRRSRAREALPPSHALDAPPRAAGPPRARDPPASTRPVRQGATESVRRGAADEDRRPRRPRTEEERLAVRLDHVVGEAAVDEGERLVGERPAASQIDPEGAELRRHPADADPEEEPPAGELLGGRDRLGRRQRWTVGKHEDARPEA